MTISLLNKKGILELYYQVLINRFYFLIFSLLSLQLNLQSCQLETPLGNKPSCALALAELKAPMRFRYPHEKYSRR
jgi:hypothetical protein